MKNYKINIRPLFSTVYFCPYCVFSEGFFISFQIISHFSLKSCLSCVAFEIHMRYFEICEVTF